MPNVMTTETYNLLNEQIRQSITRRDELRTQQVEIDEQIEDVNRVILALERSLRTLAPVVREAAPAKPERSFRPDQLDKDTAEALSILERQGGLTEPNA